jgi:hypothetical protein
VYKEKHCKISDRGGVNRESSDTFFAKVMYFSNVSSFYSSYHRHLVMFFYTDHFLPPIISNCKVWISEGWWISEIVWNLANFFVHDPDLLYLVVRSGKCFNNFNSSMAISNQPWFKAHDNCSEVFQAYDLRVRLHFQNSNVVKFDNFTISRQIW